ncbi:hypothetical protein RR48_01422 [Papilio machaon]|uniref:Uncharacterized protein n=1 Tax=Papilio machaon TaxID=76193 RepID=A0A0N1IH36_PAPMA|nr:hypothetical protein RR48_01422 [Papilio machaon]
MSDRKEENEEKNESGVGWMVAAGVAIGAAASAIGYIPQPSVDVREMCNLPRRHGRCSSALQTHLPREMCQSMAYREWDLPNLQDPCA